MAEYLLEEGYKDAAAVIAGSVLEEHLRQLATRSGVPITFVDNKGKTKPQKADTLNADLAKANVYLSTHNKQVTAWLGLRNSAAHGKYGDYTHDEVRLMIAGIVNFMASFPA